jgi:hypothetical protein
MTDRQPTPEAKAASDKIELLRFDNRTGKLVLKDEAHDLIALALDDFAAARFKAGYDAAKYDQDRAIGMSEDQHLVRAIKTPADYAATLARIDGLMGAEKDTPQGIELDVLADLVEMYERRNTPLGYAAWETPRMTSTEWAIAAQFVVGIHNRRRLAEALKAYGDVRQKRGEPDLNKLFTLMDSADEALDKETYDEKKRDDFDTPDDAEWVVTAGTCRKAEKVFAEVDRIRRHFNGV